ncbi:hypothetical protein BGX26_004425, partial [Mortierella sp. AD094]
FAETGPESLLLCSFERFGSGTGPILDSQSYFKRTLSLDCDSSVALHFDDSILQGQQHSTAESESTVENPEHPIGNNQNNNNNNYTNTTTTPDGATQSPKSQQPDSVHSLRVLRLHKTSLSDHELLRLAQECPQLEELYLHQESGALTGGHHTSPESITYLNSNVSTTSAAAAGYHQWNWSTEFVTDLSKSCPNLARLYLSPGCFQSLPEKVILKVLDAFPRLHILGTPFSQFGDQAMEEILRTRTRTKTEKIQSTAAAESRTESTLPTTVASLSPQRYTALTSLDISHLKSNRLSSILLQTFLEQSTTLVHFRGDEHMIRVSDMTTDNSHSQSRTLRPWGCLKLETLVVGFQFHDNVGGCGPQTTTADDLDFDEIIYQQLSLLTKLRKLEILKDGPSCRQREEGGGGGEEENSGLRLLSSLSLLQSFKVSNRRMAPDTESLKYQLDTVRWMAQSWCCLQQLYLPWGGSTQRTKQLGQLLHDMGRSNIELEL